MEHVNPVTPDRLPARWRRPLRAWTAAQVAAARSSVVLAVREPLARRAAIDETPPYEEQDLLRRLREAGL